MNFPAVRLTLASSFLVLMTACGGGGGGGASTAPAASSGTPTVDATTPTVGAEAPENTGGSSAGTPAVPPAILDPVVPPPQLVPVAVVPSNVDVLVLKNARVDASKSTGVNGNAVSYLWTLESRPAASNSSLLDATLSTVSLWADVVGTYKLKLVVSSGGKSAGPVYVDVQAVAPGALPPIGTFKASGFRASTAANVNGCNFYRSPANFATFWDFQPNMYELNCGFFTSPSTKPADLVQNGMFGGGSLPYLALNLSNLQGSGVSATSQATWFDVNNVSGYEYGISAEALDLATIPKNTATGSKFTHSMNPAYVYPYSSGTVQYKVEGTLVPTNVPAGWEVSQDITVRVTVEGTTFVNSQPGYASAPVFEKTYTADFSETIPLSLNWAQLPVAFANNAAYRAEVVHRFVFKRTTE